MKLLTNAGTGVTGTAVDLPDPRGRIRGHLWTLFVDGTFSGTTVTFEISPDGTNWWTPTNGTFTAKAVANFEFRAKSARASTSGGTGTGLNVWLE
jgi:hypothetical protein